MNARQSFLLVVGVAIVSFSAPLIRVVDAPALTVAMYRNVFAAAVLVPLAVMFSRKQLQSLSRRDVLALVGSGLLLAIHFGTWIPSVRLTTVAASTVLVSTSPLWTALFARVFLHDRLPRAVLAGTGIAFAGAMLISGFDFTLSLRAFGGDMLALAGAAAVAGHRVMGLGPRKRLDVLPFVAVVYGVCAVGLAVFVPLTGNRVTGFSVESWVFMILMALGPQLVGHTLFNFLLRDVDPTVLAVAIMGEAVGATLLALAFFGEVPTTGAIAGGVLLLLGIFVSVRAQSRRLLETPVE